MNDISGKLFGGQAKHMDKSSLSRSWCEALMRSGISQGFCQQIRLVHICPQLSETVRNCQKLSETEPKTECHLEYLPECHPEYHPECHPECQYQLDMVRSHTVKV